MVSVGKTKKSPCEPLTFILMSGHLKVEDRAIEPGKGF
jgi:hypothetical protein